MQPLVRLASLMLVLSLCACATTRRQEEIKVTLVNLRLGEATVWETTAYVTLRVQNESPLPLVLDGGVHKLYLNGLSIGEGLTNERLEIPRLDSATQIVTVHLRNLAMATRLRSIIELHAAEYRLSSKLYLLENGRSRRCRLSSEGRLDAGDFQPSR
jgi:LEA14-like dessication related protein